VPATSASTERHFSSVGLLCPSDNLSTRIAQGQKASSSARPTTLHEKELPPKDREVLRLLRRSPRRSRYTTPHEHTRGSGYDLRLRELPLITRTLRDSVSSSIRNRISCGTSNDSRVVSIEMYDYNLVITVSHARTSRTSSVVFFKTGKSTALQEYAEVLKLLDLLVVALFRGRSSGVLKR